MPSLGALLSLASAAAFGVMAIFGKLAYDEGANLGTLLSTRFVLAAALLWLVVAARSRGAHRPPRPARRDVVIALALGAVGYSAQASAFFAALQRIDASVLALVLYTFPTIVTVASILLGRERASRRTTVALVLASIGLVLVLAGAGGGRLDPVGAALGLAAAVVFSTFLIVSEGVTARLGPLVLTTLVCTGAGIALTLIGLVRGDVNPSAVSLAGFGWLAAIALVSTVGAVGLLFAGLRRVGPTAAAILSTLEPVVTVVLAFVVFGESLGPAQLAGGAFVLVAVLVVRVPVRLAPTRSPARGPAGPAGWPPEATEGGEA